MPVENGWNSISRDKLPVFIFKKSTITKQNGGGHVTGSGSGPKPAVYLY